MAEVADMTTPRTLKDLQEAARSFNTKNHSSYLAEALQILRDTADPLAALKLLCAMWGSPFASRVEQREALNEVGLWLEDRIYREPDADPDVITWELGWLRRFVHIAIASSEKDHRPELRRSEQGRQETPPIQEFGGRINGIEKRRTEAAEAQRLLPIARAVQPPLPPPTPLPTQLPRMFQAGFVDFVDARQARQTARKRAKSGKPAKERWLDLRPVDPRLEPLAAGLVCSVHSTKGFDELFEAEQQSFYVCAFEEREGRKVVITIALQPPVDDAQATGKSP